MKKSIRIVSFFLVLLMTVSSLASCFSQESQGEKATDSASPSGTSDQLTQEKTESHVAQTEAATEIPTKRPSSKPSSESTNVPTDAPTNEFDKDVEVSIDDLFGGNATDAPTNEFDKDFEVSIDDLFGGNATDAPSVGGTDKPTEGGTEDNVTVVDDRLEAFKKLNLPASEIIISLSKFTSTEIPNESWQYVQGPERTGSDSVLNLVYERNQQVEDVTNVSPAYVYTNLNYAGIAEDVRKHVMMPSAETPDLYIDQIYGMVRAQMEGNLKNVLSDETNYFDFGTDKTANYQGWYNSYMNGFNFASDEKMYMLAGDYFMDVIRMLNLTAVNLTNFEEYFYGRGGKDYLYNTVEAGNWTIDQMVEWSNTAYKDTNNNSKKDKTDRLGVLVYNGGPSAMSLLPAHDVSLYQVSADGKTYKVEKSDRAVNSINAWQAVFASKGAHVLKTTEAANGYVDLATTFIDGDVLFAPGIQLFQLETQEMKSMEDEKCLVPYPKLYASDPYYVTTHDNARVGGILKTTQKFEAVSAYLQAASMTSDTILDEYYNVALKYKNGTDYGSTKMLDIVYDHICNPKWIVDSAILTVTNNAFTNSTQNPTQYGRVTQDKTNTYASTYTAAQSRLTSALNSYKHIFDALK